MPVTKPKVRGDLASVEVDGEGVVYDPQTDGVHHLNRTANIVFQLCDGKATMAETACDISQAFNTPVADVEKDVRGIVKEFRALSLLEPNSPGARTIAASSRSTRSRREVRLAAERSP
jgi:hypothetical protein